MSSRGHLKVLNVNKTNILREVFVNCDKVTVCSLSSGEFIGIGAHGQSLALAVLSSPCNSQLIDLGSSISLWHFQDDKIHVLLDNDEIKVLAIRNGKWYSSTVFEYTGPGVKIAGFFPIKDCYILAINNGFTSTIAFTVAPKTIRVVGFIDRIRESQKITFAVLPHQLLQGSIILLGTEEGHVYKFSQDADLVLLCDLEQPIATIFCFPKHYVIVGEFGKLVLLDLITKKAASGFGPTAIMNCCLSNDVIYVQSPESFLYSMQLQLDQREENFIGDVKYSQVKFVRGFFVREDFAVVLTESGTAYRTSLDFQGENPKTKRTGSEVKPLLEEIHRKADELDELNRLGADVLSDLNQLSTVMHLVGKDLNSEFPIDVLSYSFPCSEGKERLQIKIKNDSEWNFPSTHWSLQIFTNHKQQLSSGLPSVWTTGQTVELLLPLELENSSFTSKLQAFLIFRIASPHVRQAVPQVACAFPVNSIELGVLDLLEPTTKDQASVTDISCDFIGFSKRKMPDNPWPVLLKKSWHRGVGQLLSESLPPPEIYVTYASNAIKFSLEEDRSQTEEVWILRVETTRLDLLRHIRFEMSQIIKDDPISAISDVVRIPSVALRQLQNLRERLNFIRSLKSCTEKDFEHLMEEIRQLFAKEFYIR